MARRITSDGDLIFDVESGDESTEAFRSLRYGDQYFGGDTGDIVFRTGRQERGRIKADGTTTGVLAALAQTLASLLGISTDAGAHKITNLADPAAPQDAATKHYADSLVPTLSSLLATSTDAGSHRIANLTDPASAQDAATKSYVDTSIKVASKTTQAGTTYTFALTDLGVTVEATSATATTFTIPPNSSVAYPVGALLIARQAGAGALTIAAGAGVTLDYDPSVIPTTGGQWDTIILEQRATNEWVVGGELATVRAKGLLELQLSPLGLVSANFHPVLCAATSSPTSQKAYLLDVGLQKGMAITAIQLNVQTAAAGLAPTGAYVGIADANGVVLAQSGNLSSAPGWTATGFQNFSLGSTYTVPADGKYYVFFLVNGTWGTTQPLFSRSNSSIADDTRLTAAASGLSTPPANGSSFTLTTSGVLHFFAGCVGT